MLTQSISEANQNPGSQTGSQELAELRRENWRLHEDVEILKRATAFFTMRAVAGQFDDGMSRKTRPVPRRGDRAFSGTLRHVSR